MRVIDLSRLLPGPFCARILSEFGAEVIKVEHPQGGDWTRQAPPLDPVRGESLVFRALNRGKKSLTLDLKTPEGRSILLELVTGADVLLETFRPGVLENLGLGYDALAEANPRLVYCSLTGYGSQGPYRTRAGHDLNYAGLSGLLDLTGPRDGPPSMPGAPVADMMGALWATVGILLALLEREHSGEGQEVESSLLGGALSCLQLAVAQLAGGHPPQRGSGDLTGGQICYQLYATRDGGYVTLSAIEPHFWFEFCQAVGRPHLREAQHAPAVPGEPAYDELCHLFALRSRAEWLELLDGLDVCCEPVYTIEEALSSPAAQALEMLEGETLRSPLRLSALSRADLGDAPGLGQHSRSILLDLGYDITAIEALAARGITSCH